MENGLIKEVMSIKDHDPKKEIDGVISFNISNRYACLPLSYNILANQLSAWRTLFKKLEILGQDPNRYQGVGYGNLSALTQIMPQKHQARQFLITGSQTGGLTQVSLKDYSLIQSYQLDTHELKSTGEVLPSSESMTHAAIYELDLDIKYVFHVHSPIIWHNAQALNLPCTADHIQYGTREMARTVQDLYQQDLFTLGQVLVMGGHEDGVICCGRSAEEAGQALIQAWIHAQSLR